MTLATPEAAIINPSAARARTQTAQETARASLKKTETERKTKNAQRKVYNPRKWASAVIGMSRGIREESIVARHAQKIERIERRTGVLLSPDLNLNGKTIRQLARASRGPNFGTKLEGAVGQPRAQELAGQKSAARQTMEALSRDPQAVLQQGEGIVLRSVDATQNAHLAPGTDTLRDAIAQVRREAQGRRVFADGQRIEARLKAVIEAAEKTAATRAGGRPVGDVDHLLEQAGLTTRDIARGVIEQIRDYQAHRAGTQNIDAYINSHSAEVIANASDRAQLQNHTGLQRWLHDYSVLSRVIYKIPIARGAYDYVASSVRNGRLLVGAAVAVGLITLPAHAPVSLAIVGVAAALARTRHHMIQRGILQRQVRSDVINQGWRPGKSTKEIRQESKYKINPFHIRDRLSDDYRRAQIYERVFKPLERDNYVLNTGSVQTDVARIAGALTTPAGQTDAIRYAADLSARISLATRGDVLFTLNQTPAGAPSLQATLDVLRTQRDQLVTALRSQTPPLADLDRTLQAQMMTRRDQLVQLHQQAERALRNDTLINTTENLVTLAAFMAGGYEVGQGIRSGVEAIAQSPVGEWVSNTPAVQWMSHNLGLRNLEQHLPWSHNAAPQTEVAQHINTHVVDMHVNGQDIKVNLPENMTVDASNHIMVGDHQVGILQNMHPDGHGGVAMQVHITDSSFHFPNGAHDITLDTSTTGPQALDFQHDIALNSAVHPDATGNLQQPLSVTENAHGGVTVMGTGENGGPFNAMGFNVTDATGHAHSMVVYGSNGEIQFNPTDTAKSYFVSFDGQAPIKMTSADICGLTHITSQAISTHPNVGGQIQGLFGNNATALHDSNIWSPSGHANELTRLGPSATETISAPNLQIPRVLSVDLSNIQSDQGWGFGGYGNTPAVHGPNEQNFIPEIHLGGFWVGPDGVSVQMPVGFPGNDGDRVYTAGWSGLATVSGLGAGLGILREARGKLFWMNPKGAKQHVALGFAGGVYGVGGTTVAAVVLHNPAVIPFGLLFTPSYLAGRGVGKIGKAVVGQVKRILPAKQTPVQQQQRAARQTRQQQRVQQAQQAVHVAATNIQATPGTSSQQVVQAAIQTAQQQRHLTPPQRVEAIFAVPNIALNEQQRAQVIVQAGNLHLLPRMRNGAYRNLEGGIRRMAQAHNVPETAIRQQVMAEALVRAVGSTREVNIAIDNLAGSPISVEQFTGILVQNGFTFQDAQLVAGLVRTRLGRRGLGFEEAIRQQLPVARVRQENGRSLDGTRPDILEQVIVIGGFTQRPNVYQRAKINEILHQNHTETAYDRAFLTIATQNVIGRMFIDGAGAYSAADAQQVANNVITALNQRYNLSIPLLNWTNISEQQEFYALAQTFLPADATVAEYTQYEEFLEYLDSDLEHLTIISGTTRPTNDEIISTIVDAFDDVIAAPQVHVAPIAPPPPPPPPVAPVHTGPISGPITQPVPAVRQPRGPSPAQRVFSTLGGVVPGVINRVGQMPLFNRQARIARQQTRPLPSGVASGQSPSTSASSLPLPYDYDSQPYSGGGAPYGTGPFPGFVEGVDTIHPGTFAQARERLGELRANSQASQQAQQDIMIAEQEYVLAAESASDFDQALREIYGDALIDSQDIPSQFARIQAAADRNMEIGDYLEELDHLQSSPQP